MSNLILISFVFFGAIIGSFANVIALRLHTGRSIIKGRSECGSCGKRLFWYELIPLFSYLFSIGRCRMCKSLIGPRYFIVEGVFGFFFVFLFLKEGLTLSFILSLLFITLVGIMVLYDIAHTIIPTEFVYPSIILAGIILFLRIGWTDFFLFSILSALSIALFMFALHFFSKGRAMGFADTPFAFMMALFVGYPISISGILLSFYIGAIIGIILLLYARKHRTIDREMPFAPYLALGFLCVYLFNINLLPLF